MVPSHLPPTSMKLTLHTIDCIHPTLDQDIYIDEEVLQVSATGPGLVGVSPSERKLSMLKLVFQDEDFLGGKNDLRLKCWFS